MEIDHLFDLFITSYLFRWISPIWSIMEMCGVVYVCVYIHVGTIFFVLRLWGALFRLSDNFFGFMVVVCRVRLIFHSFFI